MKSTDDHQDDSGWRILIVGTGGQGVLTAARLLCDVFVYQGYQIVSGQLHGMAQRGGSVQSSVMIDSGISPVIPRNRAGFVLGFEPVETARALPFISPETVVYMNTTPVVPYILGQRSILKQMGAEYPDVQELVDCIHSVTPCAYAFDATELAIEAGSVRAVNIIMLGCLLGSGLLPCTAGDFWNTVTKTMPPHLVTANNNAFSRGVELGKSFRSGERKP